MRALVSAAFGASFVIAGCNSILGLNDVRELDGGGPGIDSPPATFYPMQITRQVLDSDDTTITYPPIANLQVQAGQVDPAAPLHMLPVAADGTFQVPGDLTAKTYRLVFTIDDVTTELQSRLTAGHFLVPTIGRLDRQPTPADAEITFTPNGGPAGFNDAHVFSLGLWTVYDHGILLAPSLTFDYQVSSLSLSGTQGSLEAARGDYELLIDMTNAPSGHVTSGFAIMAVDHLQPMNQGAVTAASTWMAPPANTALKWSPGSENPVGRLDTALGENVGTGTTVHAAGVIPNISVPPFTDAIAAGVDRPAFLTLATMPASTSPVAFLNPLATTPVATALYSRDTQTRPPTHGVALTSGFQVLIPTPNGNASAVSLDYPVGIAINTMFGGKVMTYMADASIMAGGAPLLDLVFGTDKPVDDCIVTVYQFYATGLTTVRRYWVQQPPTTVVPLQIATSVFDASHVYTLAITCRTGFPRAAAGDYTQVGPVFAESTVYTSAFTVQ